MPDSLDSAASSKLTPPPPVVQSLKDKMGDIMQCGGASDSGSHVAAGDGASSSAPDVRLQPHLP
jgi:hypothetical protein